MHELARQDLIVEGDRVSTAALRHIKVAEFSQAKLEISAAKSLYQR
jgi:hypothetical protein